ncbi:unnamed protein product [Paramecium sonneborni]|uniref:Uncharacterized protein n=1 Tax=Paramecium sonneborni TaxID=65129 RepID=A0A8S1MU47_9CILI|nr:unnamed protein product [Paramecium sonneborni]
MNKDGFENFDEDIISSRPLGHFHLLNSVPQQKNFNILVVQKMNVEGPNLMQKYIVEPLQQVGQQAVEGTKNAIVSLPQFFKWGACELFNKLTSSFHKSSESIQPQPQQNQQQEQQPPEDDIDDLPVVFVVPKEILEGPLAERLKWIDKHKNNCEVFVPFEKPMKLNTFNGLHTSSSSSSNSPDDCDCEVRRISQEFQSQYTASELFPSTESIKSKLMKSNQRYVMSQDDYKLINQQNNENQDQTQTQTQNIILYPFLGEMAPKDQILNQIKNNQLHQSPDPVIQPNFNQIQIQPTSQYIQNQFIPLNLNGISFDNNVQNTNLQQQQSKQLQQQQKQQKQEEEVNYQRQLEPMLEI